MNYKNIHDRIIEKSKKENRSKSDGNYYEAHHIKPRCMDGKGKTTEWRTHPNIVLLTPKEHFIIHKLLCEIYPSNYKLIHAYWLFVNNTQSKNHKGNKYYNIGSREYEILKIKRSEILSDSNSGEGNPMFNKSHSEETKQKMKKPKSEEHKQNLRKPKSEKGKKNIKESAYDRHGEKNPMFNKKGEDAPSSRKVICVVTGKTYVSIKNAAEDIGINLNTLKGYLRGNNPNKTSIVYV